MPRALGIIDLYRSGSASFCTTCRPSQSADVRDRISSEAFGRDRLRSSRTPELAAGPRWQRLCIEAKRANCRAAPDASWMTLRFSNAATVLVHQRRIHDRDADRGDQRRLLRGFFPLRHSTFPCKTRLRRESARPETGCSIHTSSCQHSRGLQPSSVTSECTRCTRFDGTLLALRRTAVP